MPNPCQKPPAPIKDKNQDLKDMDVLCTFKIKLNGQNSDHGCLKEQLLYSNQDPNVKPQSRSFDFIKH